MDTLIKNILQIESDAQNLIAKEKERQAHFEADCSEKRAQLEREIGGRCARRIAQMQEAEEVYRAKEIAKIGAETQQSLEKLEECYKENKEKWICQLVDHVLGGE